MYTASEEEGAIAVTEEEQQVEQEQNYNDAFGAQFSAPEVESGYGNSGIAFHSRLDEEEKETAQPYVEEEEEEEPPETIREQIKFKKPRKRRTERTYETDKPHVEH